MTKEMKKLQVLIKKAGSYARAHFDSLHRTHIYEKSRYEKVTSVDTYIHRMMKRELPRVKNLPVLSEENTKHWKACASFWVLDPIDGTTNFITHIPYFCIAIGLVEHGVITKNVIYNPMLNELLWAEKGVGAFLNGKKLRKDHRLSLRQSIVDFSYSHQKASIAKAGRIADALRPKVHNIRHAGSTVLSLAYVATGRLEAEVIAGPITPWDTIPALLLLSEVKGRVTNFEGKPYELLKTKNLVASNGADHAKLLTAIRSTT